MKRITLFLLAFICLAFTSCSLLDDIEPTPDEDKLPPNTLTSSRYYFSDKTSNQIKYIYNRAGNLLRKDWYTQNNVIDFQENFIYENGVLVKIKRSATNDEFAEVRFTYKNGLTKSLEYWMEDTDSTLSRLHTTVYEYSGSLITKATTTFYNGGPSYYSVYTYENGNITSVKAYNLSSHVLLEEDYYTYDNKPNPFYKLTNQYHGSPVNSSRNNVVHYKIVSYNHIPSKPEMSYEYIYNDKGYPVEKFILGNANKRYLDESFSYND
ncbi:hypothetical protein Q0590_15855 [Rhodocytophaga aerolata]|uniref:DUF4595 domain-containing protein n=1 Tax=Rhodocytophaga aerolata TaxID=455078 RepID=A0ABT8R7T4_9BACT|nr:hypothetical protein [Rhodocytophaga aerolata]MDO1447746.1 hypothetical protein [Rhodocytophaga aerolata]